MVNLAKPQNSFWATRQELLGPAFALRTDSGYLEGTKAPPAPAGLSKLRVIFQACSDSDLQRQPEVSHLFEDLHEIR